MKESFILAAGQFSSQMNTINTHGRNHKKNNCVQQNKILKLSPILSGHLYIYTFMSILDNNLGV
jgi:hypothetical protein